MEIELSIFAAHIILLLGLYGVATNRYNLIICLICLEMSLLGASLLFVGVGLILDDATGQLIFFLLLTIAGVESALGLALVILYYRVRAEVKMSSIVTTAG